MIPEMVLLVLDAMNKPLNDTICMNKLFNSCSFDFFYIYTETWDATSISHCLQAIHTLLMAVVSNSAAIRLCGPHTIHAVRLI